MAAKKQPGRLVNEASILGENAHYTPQPGIRYEVKDGIIVTMKKVTPALVIAYNKLKFGSGRADTIESPEDLERKVDEEMKNDPAAGIMALIDRCQCVTDHPAEVQDSEKWLEFDLPVLWRIVEDFMTLSNPRTKRRES